MVIWCACLDCSAERLVRHQIKRCHETVLYAINLINTLWVKQSTPQSTLQLTQSAEGYHWKNRFPPAFNIETLKMTLKATAQGYSTVCALWGYLSLYLDGKYFLKEALYSLNIWLCKLSYLNPFKNQMETNVSIISKVVAIMFLFFPKQFSPVKPCQ